MKVFFCVHGAFSLCRSGPCGRRRSSYVRKYAPVAAPRQNPPGCAITLLIPAWLAVAPFVRLNAGQASSIRCAADVPPDGKSEVLAYASVDVITCYVLRLSALTCQMPG